MLNLLEFVLFKFTVENAESICVCSSQ